MKSTACRQFVSGTIVCGVLAAFLIPGCVMRDNPWDPLNRTFSVCDYEAAALTGDTLTAQFNQSSANLSVFEKRLDTLKRQVVTDSARIGASTVAAQEQETLNLAIRQSNDSLTDRNATLPPDAREELSFLHLPVVPVPPRQPHPQADTRPGIARDIALLHTLYNRLDTLCDHATAPHRPLLDSVLDAAQRLLTEAEALYERGVRLHLAWHETLLPWLQESERAVSSYNDSVQTINTRLAFDSRFAHHSPIDNADTLARRIASIESADTLVLAGTVIAGAMRFPQRGSFERPVLIIGQPDGSTVLTEGPVLIDNTGSIHFSDITFRMDGNEGVRILNASGPVRFTRCTFADNHGYGLEIADSDVHLLHCRIVGNGGNGLSVNADPHLKRTVVLDNTLVAGNRVAGIKVVGCRLTLRTCTIADNAQHGIHAPNPQLEIAIFSSIVAFNTGFGLFFNPVYESPYPQNVLQTLFWANSSGDINDSPLSSPPLTVANPLFADRNSRDYTPTAPHLLELETSGIVIGYRP